MKVNEKNLKSLNTRAKAMAKRITILDGWDISADVEGNETKAVSINVVDRIANIMPWGAGKEPQDYVLHEVLHIAFSEIDLYYRYLLEEDSEEEIDKAEEFIKAAEESLIKDICKIYKSKKRNDRKER